MTTIVVARKGNYACIGADTQSSFGHIKESLKYKISYTKINKVRDSFIASTGDVSIRFVIHNYFNRAKVKASFSNCEEIFETFRYMHGILKKDYYLNVHAEEGDSFEYSNMELLIANANGIFGVYGERSVIEYSRFFAMGSGRDLALGAMYAAYECHESPEDIARAGIAAAAEFDEKTGLPAMFETIRLKNSRKGPKKPDE